jgi:hypothetical protein
MASSSIDVESRQSAIARVSGARREMSEVLLEIAAEMRSMAAVLQKSDEEALNRLYVVKVLESFKVVGKIRARQALDDLRIEHKRKISNLTSVERDALLRELQ